METGRHTGSWQGAPSVPGSMGTLCFAEASPCVGLTVHGNLPGDSVGRAVPRLGAHARQAGPSPRTSAPPRGPGRGRLPSAAQASREQAHSTRAVTWGDDAPELALSSAREERLDAHVPRELRVPGCVWEGHPAVPCCATVTRDATGQSAGQTVSLSGRVTQLSGSHTHQ